MDGGFGLTLVPCPACSALAEVTDHFRLPSTDGPVSLVVTQCFNEHCFRMPAEDFFDSHAWHSALAARHPAYALSGWRAAPSSGGVRRRSN
jgi:hypothetical protein